MPLQKRLIDVPLALGLNQKADSRYLQIGEASVLTNCRKLKNHAIRKRFGNTKVNLDLLPSYIAGGSYKTKPLVFTSAPPQAILEEWSETGQRLNNVGYLSDVGLLDQVSVSSFPGSIADVQIETGNGYTIVAYTGDGLGLGTTQVWTTVLDANGAEVWAAQPLTLTGPAVVVAQGIKLVVLGTTCVLAYCPNATTINAVTMNLTHPQTGWSLAATNLATDVQNTNAGAVAVGVFDAQPVINDPTRFVIAYPTGTLAGPSWGMRVKTFNAGLSLQVTTDSAPIVGTAIWAVAVYTRSGEQTWCAFQDDRANGVGHPGILAFAFTDPGGAASAAVLVGLDNLNDTNAGKVTIETNENGTDVTIGWCPDVVPGPAGITNAWTKFRQCHFAAGAVTTVNTQVFVPGVLLGSKPAAAGSTQAYVIMYCPSLTQGTQYLVALDWWGQNVTQAGPMRIAATLAPRQWKGILPAHSGAMSGGAAAISVSLQRMIAANAGTDLTAAIFQSQAQSHQGVALQRMQCQLPSRFFTAELADELVIGSGCSMIFDGQESVELGYAYYPEVGPPVIAGAGLTGTFSYIFIWEWYDARGNVHWSATSPALTVILGNNVPTFTLPALGLTYRGPSTNPVPPISAQVPPPALIPYRTTNGGTIYYRNTTDPAPTAFINQGTNFTNGNYTWTDTTTDAALTAAGTQLLYTTGGVLDNFIPPGKNICIAHKGRAWLGGGGQASDLWPSSVFSPLGGIAPGFNEALVFPLSGALRGLASLDEKLIVFYQQGSRYGVEYITGDGPTNIGTQSDWTPPQPVPTGGVGCVDQRSLASTDQGVIFLSPIGGPNGKGGFFILTRGLEVQYIGGPVEDLIAANPVCTSAVVHPTSGYVYFTMSPVDVPVATTGIRLVWDYIQKVWSQDTMPDPTGTNAQAGAQWGFTALGASGLTYYWLSLGGNMYRESVGIGAGSYLDAGGWITMAYTSAQVKTALSGFHRFWRMQAQADSLDPCDVTFTLTFDGAPASTYNEAWSWTAGSINSFDRFPIVDVEFLIGNQKAKALTVSYSDAPPTGGAIALTGQGVSLAAFTIELGVDGTRYPNIPAGQRA